MKGQLNNRMNIFILSVFAIVLIVSFSMFTKATTTYSLCYQESANTSNQVGTDGNCGLNYTGSYSNSTNYFLVNYTKPLNSVGAIWQVRHGNDSSISYNVSMPDSCFNYGSQIQLRFYSNFSVLSSSYGQCYNGTWNNITNIYNYNISYFFEIFEGSSPIVVSSLYDGNWTTYGSYSTAEGYNAWVYASPGFHYSGLGAIYEEGIYWNISTTTPDTTPPYFTTIPTNTTMNYTQGFGVQFNATDDIGFGTYAINWTTLFTINSTGYLKNSTRDIKVGTYFINVTINDTSNNLNYTIYQVIVNKTTPTLTLSPTTPIIYGATTDFATHEGGCPAELTCSLNLTDRVFSARIINANYSTAGNENYSASSVIASVTINKNSTYVLGITKTTPITYGTITNFVGTGCPSQISCSLNVTNGIFSAGIINANYSTAGNENYSANSITSSITINQASSQTSLTFDKTTPQIYGTAITPTCSLLIGVGSVSLTNGTSGNPETLGAGSWNLNCSYAGNTNYSTSSNLSVFVISQATSILTFLLNGGINNFSSDYTTQLNISASSDYGTVGLDKDGVDYLINNSINVTLPVGVYIFRANITGNTNYSNVGYSYKNLTIHDSVNISVVYPLASTYYSSPTEINYLVSSNAVSCWYSTNNGATNNSITCGTNATGLTASSGSNTWLVSAQNSIGDNNMSSVTFFYDDGSEGGDDGGGGGSPTCTSFTYYSSWSSCSYGNQHRTILSHSPVGCVGGSPLSQLCDLNNGEYCSGSSQCLSGICTNGGICSATGNTGYSCSTSDDCILGLICSHQNTCGSEYYPTLTGNETTNLYTLFGWINGTATRGTFMPLMLLVIWLIAFIGALAEGRQASRGFIFASFICAILAIVLSLIGMLNHQYMYFSFLLVGAGVIWSWLQNAVGI